jgi:hypothetical protein
MQHQWRQRKLAYILRNSITSGDNGEAPEDISLTRPPSLPFILLNTSLSHTGDGFRPNGIKSKISIHYKYWW